MNSKTIYRDTCSQIRKFRRLGGQPGLVLKLEGKLGEMIRSRPRSQKPVPSGRHGLRFH